MPRLQQLAFSMKRTPLLFAAGTPMAERCRAFDWAASPLGEPLYWDGAVKTLVPIMLASNQPMFLVWGASRTLIYNDAYAEILAERHPKALGRDFLEVWAEIRDSLNPMVTAAYQGEVIRMDDIELWIDRRGQREEAHFSFFYSPVLAESGEVNGFFCACNETTPRVLAERRLAESRAQHRGVLEHMEEGFARFDRDFRFVDVNDVTCRLVNMEREALVGRSHWEAFPGSFDLPIGRLYREVLATQRAGRLEHEFTFADGRRCWFEARAFPVADGVAVLFLDVTEQKKLAQEAAASMERLDLALDAGAIVGTWVWDILADRVLADERFAQSFGLDPALLRTGASIQYAFDAIHPADRERVQAAVARSVQQCSDYRCRYRVSRQGSYRWVEASGRVEVDDQGRACRFPGVLLDVEERHRIESERDRATALLETFIEAVPGVVFAKDRQGRYLVVNRGAAEVLGRSLEEIGGRTDAELLIDPAEAAAVMARDSDLMNRGIAVQAEEWVRRADGRPAIWWSTKEPLRAPDGEVIGLVGSSVDITERKAIEDALRLSEQRSALAMEVAQLGTWHWDLRTGCIMVDERCRAMCGLGGAPASLTLADMSARVHPEDWPRVEQALAAAIAPDGPGRHAEEFRWQHADGRVVWTASRGSVQFDVTPQGRREAVAMLGSLTDVTERRQLIEALRQADRRKDEFLAMLAHELRNPLAPIKTASEVLRLSGAEPRRVADASEIIARQVGHLTRLVDDLLDVSRVTRGLVELARESVDLRDVVSTAVEQVRPLVEARRHELHTRYGAGPFTVLGDFHRLVQIVSNLLNNAAKYTPPGGQVEVELGLRDGRAVLSVTDNGVGIAPDMIDAVFDLFIQADRTPDRSQGGLGIGLALVRSLVQLHEGEVRATSLGPGRGSSFRVELPLCQQARVAQAASPEPSAGSGGRILVVDDNTDAAAALAELLGLMGHAVETAPDGTTALARAAAQADWAAFILDIGLPDMTGYEMARRLRATGAGAGAVFIALTGYGQATDRAFSRRAGFDHHLVKPADLSLLLDLLARRA
jgi:PAS domain S-box-containing protein